MGAMSAYFPYILGALGGGGVLLIWYGLKGVRNPDAATGRRRLGLAAVNLGVILIAASLYLTLRQK